MILYERIGMPYYCYILFCADGTLYTGITSDLSRRVLEHNSDNKGAKYTRSRRPVSLAYYEKLEDKSSALKREYRLKKLTRTKKLELIEQKRQE
jgi:putative endonuclease